MRTHNVTHCVCPASDPHLVSGSSLLVYTRHLLAAARRHNGIIPDVTLPIDSSSDIFSHVSLDPSVSDTLLSSVISSSTSESFICMLTRLQSCMIHCILSLSHSSVDRINPCMFLLVIRSPLPSVASPVSLAALDPNSSSLSIYISRSLLLNLCFSIYPCTLII